MYFSWLFLDLAYLVGRIPLFLSHCIMIGASLPKIVVAIIMLSISDFLSVSGSGSWVAGNVGVCSSNMDILESSKWV